MDTSKQFLEALNAGDAARIRELLAGSERDLASSYTDDGWSMLHLAPNAEIAALLLDHGARINAKNRHAVYGPENTPLAAQVYMGHRDVAALLLDRGADVDQADRAGFTPLHLAAANGRAELVELLLARGADPSPRTRAGVPVAPAGTTPLALALDETRVDDSGNPVGAERLRAVAALLRAAGATE